MSDPLPTRTGATPDAAPDGAPPPVRQPAAWGAGDVTTFAAGFALILVGLALAAMLLGIGRAWIVLGALLLLGVAALTLISRTRAR